MRKICSVFLSVLLSAVFLSCTSSESAKPMLTVSIQPQKWLLDRIVGDKFEVSALLSTGTNPETFDPAMNQLADMQKSRAYFTVGSIAFEQASIEKIRDNFPDLKIYNTSLNIEKLHGTHGHCHTDGDGHTDDSDPHVWVSVRNMKIMASDMYRYICEIDPENKSYYRNNFSKLSKQLKSMDDSISSMLKEKKNVSFLVWHPSLSYFAHDYGLHQISIETEGKEVSPKQFKQKLQEATRLSPKVFFAQKEYDTEQSTRISSLVGTRIVPISLMSYDWDKQLYAIAKALQ